MSEEKRDKKILSKNMIIVLIGVAVLAVLAVGGYITSNGGNKAVKLTDKHGDARDYMTAEEIENLRMEDQLSRDAGW